MLLDVDQLDAPGLSAPVSLTVRSGEIVGITGQLGSGTAEFIQTLAGTHPRLAGTVALSGKAVDLRGRHVGIKQGIAYCSADRKKNGIFAGISILRNLSSPWLDKVSTLGVVRSGRETDVATKTASQFAIDVKRLGSSVGTLSGGNQQKVVVGKWIGIGPKLLLVEEPTRGVDVGARAEIYKKLRELCDQGLGIIVSSSDTNEVFGLCDTVATFYRGALTNVRPKDEWTEPDLVKEVMHRSEATHA